MSTPDFPYTAKDLIEQLDKLIPHKCPDPKQDERSIWVYAGKRQLVDSLIMQLQQAHGLPELED